MDFQWIPGQGVDLEAIERMKQHFPKPTEPPYEAWFMREINYQEGFLTIPIEEFTEKDLLWPVRDWCSGLRIFGRHEVWVVWFHYLLPHMLSRVIEDPVSFDPLELHIVGINYLFNLYPAGIILEEYPGFRDDVLRTVPHVIMLPQLWRRNDLSDVLWAEGYSSYWTCPIYSALFFCVAYLSPQEIESWVASLADSMEGLSWRSQVKKWMQGMRKLVRWIEHPEEVADKFDGEPTIDDYLRLAGIWWIDAHSVFRVPVSTTNLNDYIPKVNLETFWAEIAKHPALSIV